MEIESVESVSEGRRGLWEQACHEPEDPHRLSLELRVAPQAPQPQEDVRKHRVPGRRRVVVEVLLARNELFAVDGREEEAATFVAEELDREECEAARLLEPAQLAGCDVQLVEAVGHVRVVLEHACMPCLARTPAAEKPSLRRRQRAEEERREPTRRFDVVGSVEAPPGFGERRQRKPVPGCDRLVVA